MKLTPLATIDYNLVADVIEEDYQSPVYVVVFMAGRASINIHTGELKVGNILHQHKYRGLTERAAEKIVGILRGRNPGVNIKAKLLESIK
jgi:hypothetical protein